MKTPEERFKAYQNERAKRVLNIMRKLVFIEAAPWQYPAGTRKKLQAEKRRLVGLIKKSAFTHSQRQA